MQSPSPVATSSKVFWNLVLVGVLTVASIGFVVYLASQPHVNPTRQLASQQADPPSSATSTTPTVPLSKLETAPNISLMKQQDPYLFVDLLPLGQQAPNFTVRDTLGRPVSLTDYRGKKNLVMLFYQGNDCEVCHKQLQDLTAHKIDFEKQNAALIAVSADRPSAAQRTTAKVQPSFPLVPDPDLNLIKGFGVLNISQQIAWPAVYIIDTRGKVRFAFADKGFKRLYSQDILAALSEETGIPLDEGSLDEG